MEGEGKDKEGEGWGLGIKKFFKFLGIFMLCLFMFMCLYVIIE